MKKTILTVSGYLAMLGIASAAELQKFDGCRLVGSAANDGDSFIAQTTNRQIHVRLYFVDCPETFVSTDAEAKRVREQARHFGVPDAARVVKYGAEAKAFTEKALEKPFTVHTAFASAMGRSAGGRVYAFVTTADGKDLASLLVENGLARAFGARRQTPDGTSSEQMQQRLADLEAQAMLKRAGIWAEMDPNEIGRLRQAQRDEDKELRELRKRLAGKSSAPGTVDLNTATSAEFQSISGIGPVLASRIISNRPYRAVEDLLRVNGIGPKLFERIRGALVVSPVESSKPSD
jgi:competence ComEA-like helix-hairpin-helix protein